MKKQTLLFALLFVGIISIFAQNDFRPGYIINNQGDTIKGEISFQGYDYMQQFCKFRKSQEDSFIEYGTKDIIRYVY